MVRLPLAVSVPLAVGARCLPQEAEAEAAVQMLRDHHAHVRFLPVAQKESPRVPAGAIVHGSCPGQTGVLLNRESLVLDVRCEVPSVNHQVASPGRNWQNVDHRRGNVPDGLGVLMVSVVINLSVEARVDPGLDAHGSTQHGQDAFVGLVVDHLALHEVHVDRWAVHQSHQVQGATVQVGPAIRALGEVDRRDTQDYGMAHR